MKRETFAWLVTGAAGLSSGVFAGVQHRVTTESVLVIAAVISAAVGIVSRILPRSAEPI